MNIKYLLGKCKVSKTLLVWRTIIIDEILTLV